MGAGRVNGLFSAGRGARGGEKIDDLPRGFNHHCENLVPLFVPRRFWEYPPGASIWGVMGGHMTPNVA